MSRSIRSFSASAAITVLLAAMLTGQGCPAAPPLPAAPSSLELVAEASRRVKQQDPQAIVIQMQGLYGSTIPGPSLTLEYDFTALNPDNPAESWVSWQLNFDRTNWTIEQINSPFVGIGFHDLTQVTLSFEQARAIILNAGYTDDFQVWSLHKPLFGLPNPIYTFSYGTKSVMVDTVTRQLSETPMEPVLTTPGGNSVSIQKIIDATGKIKETDPNALIFWAGGKKADGTSLNAANETDVWDFNAVDNIGNEIQAWSLSYNGNWTVNELPMPPMGFEFWDIRQIGMDVVQAWDLAVNAGHQPPFQWWVAFKPLNPTKPNPVIVFSGSAGYIVVDTVTGEVTVE